MKARWLCLPLVAALSPSFVAAQNSTRKIRSAPGELAAKAGAGVAWRDSVEDALAESAKTGKPVFWYVPSVRRSPMDRKPEIDRYMMGGPFSWSATIVLLNQHYVPVREVARGELEEGRAREEAQRARGVQRRREGRRARPTIAAVGVRGVQAGEHVQEERHERLVRAERVERARRRGRHAQQLAQPARELRRLGGDLLDQLAQPRAAAHLSEVRLRLEGVSRREDVQPLIGLLVTASPDLLPELPEGEFYWYELVGCRVESAQGEDVGIVREIWETGAHDVLLVEDPDGVRRLVPTAEALLEKIDLDARQIVVADVPGLLEPI